MLKVGILTDSTADLPQDLLNHYSIKVIPLRVHFGTDTYLEGQDLSASDFYAKLNFVEKLPTTSQPSPGDFINLFESFYNEGITEVISIHLSKKLSGTYQSALVAQKSLEGKMKIHVVDSMLVSMGLGLVVLSAARAAKEGKDSSEILEIIEDVKNKVRIYFVVDTLEYLQKGGRIGKASSLIGSLLNIKPILTLTDGEVGSFEKVRGKNKALERLIEITCETLMPDQKILCAIVHSNCLDTALKLHGKILENLNSSEIFISEIGAVVGTHVGPGTVAIMFFPE
ncbi:MAG: DegV family protein [Bacillota bacterium]